MADDKVKGIFDSVMDRVERNQDVQEGSEDSVTLSHNGRKASLSGRQLTLLANHPEMDEHINVAQEAVKIMSRQVIDSGEDGEFASKMKLRRQFVTDKGVIMDAVLTINYSAKPGKPEKQKPQRRPVFGGRRGDEDEA